MSQFSTYLYSRLNSAINSRTCPLLTEHFILLVGWCSGWLSPWRATDRGAGPWCVSQGPSQALTILAKMLGEFTRPEDFWSISYHHQSFPIPPFATSWLRQDSGWALWLLTHTWHHPWAARRSCGSQPQLNNQYPTPDSSYSPCATSAHKTVTFLKGLQAKKFWQLTGLYKFSLGWASAGNHLLQFFAMKSLRSQGQAIQSLQHKALPGSLRFGYMPAKNGDWICQTQFPVFCCSETLSKNDRLSTSPRMPMFV